MDNPVSLDLLSRTPLDPNCTYPCGRTAVIFIHGITGDRSTWGTWPELLRDDQALKEEIGIFDVYLVGYYSSLNEGPSVPSISRALGRLLDDRLFRKGYSKIVLICHSLGGILCREHLLHVKLRWGHAYLSLFRATITLGTPLQGSEQANRWIVRASANEQVRVLRTIDVNDFLQLLDNSTQEFTEKRETLGCPELQLYAGYETLETPLIEGTPLPKWEVVSKASATHGVPSARQQGFDKDHRQLVKPTNRGDLVYKWVAGILRACREGGICSTPIPAGCGRPPWIP